MSRLVNAKGSSGLFTDGDWILSKDMDSNGCVGVIQLKHIGVGDFLNKEFSFITGETFDRLKCTEVLPGDVLISRMADPIGRACLVPKLPFRCVTAVDIAILRIDDNTADPSFIMHLCNSPIVREQAEELGRGTTRLRITRKALEQISIPLPPLPEQKRIADVLNMADRLRRLRRYALELSEDFLQSVFLQMFGDPVTNPMGLKVVRLASLCKRITDGTHQPPKWSPSGYPFLFVSNVVDGEIDFDTKKFISHETWVELTTRCPIEINDILYTTVGSYGNAALVKTQRRFSFQRHIAHIKPDHQKVHPEFLLGMLQSSGIRQQADQEVRGVAQKTLNLRELKEFQVFSPDQEAQEKYVRTRRKMELMRTQQREAIRQADHLFDTLLHRAFRGEL